MRRILYVTIQGQTTFLSLKASDETYSVRYYPGTENISEP
jgi:hypothetical protein